MSRIEVRKIIIRSAVFCIYGMWVLLLGGCGASGKKVTEVSGNEISLGKIILTVESQEFRETVEPENPSGFYDIYDQYEGYRYYVGVGTVRNESSEAVRSDFFHVEGDTDGKRRKGKLLFLDEWNSVFTDKIGADESRPFILFILLEEGEKPEGFRIFYNERNQAPEDEKEFDFEVLWKISTE